ncbi:MAG: hypothetical protein HGA82_03325 [Anaerolineales bacterium]|nr:hypothetical protein [Anaerolineales bacterium]
MLAQVIKKIKGSYNNVVGNPSRTLLRLLKNYTIMKAEHL